jgi:ABC-2 type transport system permease protein
MNIAEIFWAQLRLSFVSAIQYRADYILTIMSVAISCVVEIAVWRLVMKGTGQVAGFGLSELIVYIVAANVINMMCVNWESVLSISAEIRSGTIARHLLRPISLFQVSTAEWLASKSPVIVGAVPVLFALHFAAPYEFHPSVGDVAMATAFLVLSMWLSAEIYFLIIVTAFWISENEGVAIAFNILRWGFVGQAFPLTFYPRWLLHVLEATPLPYFVYYPTIALTGRMGGSDFTLRAAYGIALGIAFYGARQAAWHLAERRLQTVGG